MFIKVCDFFPVAADWRHKPNSRPKCLLQRVVVKSSFSEISGKQHIDLSITGLERMHGINCSGFVTGSPSGLRRVISAPKNRAAPSSPLYVCDFNLI